MRTAGIIFSNIHDRDINELTLKRTLASVPFGGRFRLIDFVLSNMVNSDITKVAIITKENYQSLMDHIGSGKYWDLSRKNGGLMVLPPYGTKGSGYYSSRFEAMKNATNFLRKATEDFVVMSDCDNVCNFDYAAPLEQHVLTNADITVIYRKNIVDKSSADKERTIFAIGKNGRVQKTSDVFDYSGECNEYTNMVVINRRLLLNLIETSAQTGIKSFSGDVLTRVDELRIYGYEYKGYFATIDSIPSYYRHSIEILDKKNREELFNSNGARIYTKVRDSAPCVIESGANVSNSLIADGCIIEGSVKNSILFRGVRVAKGAVIENSIVFQDTVVSKNSRLNCVIADKEAMILENRTLSGHETQPYFIAKGKTI